MLLRATDNLVARIIVVLALAIALLASLGTTPVYAAQKIKQINVVEGTDAVTINITAANPIVMTGGRTNDRYLAFDVCGNLPSPDQKCVRMHDGGILKVVFGWYQSKPPVARIAVCVSGHRAFSVDYTDGKRCAVIRIKKDPAEHSRKASSFAAVKLPNLPALPAHSVLVASADPFRSAAGSTETSKSVQKISLDFIGSDIHDVVKALAVQAGVNIVAGPDVKGEVTVSLADVTVDEALKLVTGLIGCRYSLVNGTYVIGTSSNLQAMTAGLSGSSSTTEVVVVRYADPAFVSKMLAAQFNTVQVSSNSVSSDGKRIEPTDGVSVLVLTGSAGDVQAAKAMAENIENSLAANASCSVVDLYEVRYVDINELAAILTTAVPSIKVSVGPHVGFNMKCAATTGLGATSSSGSSSGGSSLTSGGSGAGLGASSADTGMGASGGSSKSQIAQPKVLVMQGTAEEISKAKAFLNKIDVQQPQIIIEAKVIDISTDASRSLGLDWTFNKVNVEEESRNPAAQATAFNSPITDVHLGKFSRTPLEMVAQINAIVKDGRGKVLANPQVLALDGKLASIFIGDEVKYVSSVQQTPSGTNVTTDTASVGVVLNSVSKISSDGFITMNLHPEVSVISNWVSTPDGGSLPQISRRYVDSTIRVKDGETIVIGGLIRDDDIDSMSGLPILKDLPFFGSLFRTKTVSKQHSEVMMFITPRVVSAL